MRITRGILIGAEAQDALVRLASEAEAQALIQLAKQSGDDSVALSHGIRMARPSDWQKIGLGETAIYMQAGGEFVLFGQLTRLQWEAPIDGLMRVSGEFDGMVGP
jgi:hypothetical protein